MTGLVDQRDEKDVTELEFYKFKLLNLPSICSSTDDCKSGETCCAGLLKSTALKGFRVQLAGRGLGSRNLVCIWHRNKSLVDPSLCSPVPNIVLACVQWHLSREGIVGREATAWGIITTLRGMDDQKLECWRRLPPARKVNSQTIWDNLGMNLHCWRCFITNYFDIFYK